MCSAHVENGNMSLHTHGIRNKILRIMLLSLITLIIAYMIPVIFYRTLSGLGQYSPDMLDPLVTVEIQHPDGTAEHYSGHEFCFHAYGIVQSTAEAPVSPDEALKKADTEMYRHKHESRET